MLTTVRKSFCVVLAAWVSMLCAVGAPSVNAAQPVAPGSLHLLIPGAAGGGWDRTARGVGEALQNADLIKRVTFENMSGGGGGKAMAYLLESGKPGTLMVNSTPIVVRALQGVFPQTFRDFTPVASVIGDYSVFAVRTASPIQSLAEVGQQLLHNPRSLAIAGGSVSGGTDHIVAALTFKSFGVDPRRLKYIPYDAGGKAMAGLLSGEVQLLSSGYGEVIDLVEQGYVRMLCITARTRLAFAPKLPTCDESGASGAFFVNWRGFFAAPNMPEDQVAAYRQQLAAMFSTSAWTEVRNRYGWVDLYRPGQEFVALLNEQEQTLAVLLKELGLL